MLEDVNPYVCWTRKTYSPVVCEKCLEKVSRMGEVEAYAYIKIAELYNAFDTVVLLYCNDEGEASPAYTTLEHNGYITTTEAGNFSLYAKPMGFEDKSKLLPMFIACKLDHLSGKTGELK